MLSFAKNKPIVFRDATALYPYVRACSNWLDSDATFRLNVVLAQRFPVKTLQEAWYCNKLYIRPVHPSAAQLQLMPRVERGNVTVQWYDVVPGHFFVHIPATDRRDPSRIRVPTIYVGQWWEDHDKEAPEALAVARDAIFMGDLERAATIGQPIIPYGWLLFQTLVQREAAMLRRAAR